LVKLIQEAVQSGCRLVPACEETEVSLRTYRRWVQGKSPLRADQRPEAIRPEPTNKLSDEEVNAILAVCNQREYASLPPSQIVPKLADQGMYLASESSVYRILHEHGQVHLRGRSRVREGRSAPTSYTATGPNQVWSWDITYCASRVRGLYYYLYLIEDIYSRKIVGWEVHERECGELAADLLQRTVMREQCFKQPLVLHSDNGAPMKSVTLKAKMEELSVTGSHSRPRVSNDNPYSESLFRTLKYCPQWPSEGFKSLETVRDWVMTFVQWYNNEHCHSRIKFVTPSQRHCGQDKQMLQKRVEVYEQAKKRNPHRWSGKVRNWKHVKEVELNPDRSKQEEEKAA
jgi:putative transposase